MKKYICYGLIGLILMCNVVVIFAQKIYVENVPMINQYPELPTGCEATALTMILQHYGVEISKEEVAEVMPKAAYPTMVDGVYQGATPYDAFIGDPFTTSGFGVYTPVILDLIDYYLPGKAEDLGGDSFDKVYAALDEGRPVMVWATLGMLEPFETTRWQGLDGETFIWLAQEHALVVVGYDENSIYCNDPSTGTERAYDKTLFLTRWEQLGSQAVAINAQMPAVHTMDEQCDALIDQTMYLNIVSVNEDGEWFPIKVLEGLHGGTSTYRDEALGQYIIEITENKRTHTYKLDRMEEPLVTYNKDEEEVILKYQIVDDRAYVSREWVADYYGFKMVVLKNLQ